MRIFKRPLQILNLPVVTLCVAACDSSLPPDSYQGYIEVDWHYVAAPQAGWLASSSLKRGDLVAKGDVLFELDNELQQAQLEQAQANARQAQSSAADISKGARPAEINVLQAQLDQAQANFERAKSERDRVLPLVERDIEAKVRGDQVNAEYARTKAAVVAAQEAINVAKLAGRQDAVLAAQSAKASADAAVAAAKWQVQQRTIAAPIDAKVEDVFYTAGEYVVAGSPVLALYSDQALLAHFFVSQAQLPTLKVGQTVWVSSDGLAKPIKAQIAFVAATPEFTPPIIYSVGSREKLVFRVEAKLTSADGLHAGLPVQISLVNP